MTYDRSFPLELRPNWGYETTSETHDTLLEEVTEHLADAPNVRSFHPIFADYHTNVGPIGFLVILEDGKRLTVLASERDVIHFGPEGQVIPGGPDFLKQDSYRVIYSPRFAKGDELPYDEDVRTAEEAYAWWLKDMRGDTSTFRRMEKRTIVTSDWSEVRDA